MGRKKPDHPPSPEELANDRSLRWVPYRYAELLWSDELQDNVRFLRYDEAGRIAVASYAGISDLGIALDPLKTRRLTGNYTRSQLLGDSHGPG